MILAREGRGPGDHRDGRIERKAPGDAAAPGSDLFKRTSAERYSQSTLLLERPLLDFGGFLFDKRYQRNVT